MQRFLFVWEGGNATVKLVKSTWRSVLHGPIIKRNLSWKTPRCCCFPATKTTQSWMHPLKSKIWSISLPLPNNVCKDSVQKTGTMTIRSDKKNIYIFSDTAEGVMLKCLFKVSPCLLESWLIRIYHQMMAKIKSITRINCGGERIV